MSSTDNVVPFNWRPEPEPEPVGFAQVSKAWLSRWSTDRRLTSGEQKICVCIYLHFNSDHFKETGDLLAWPSWQFLMDATGLSRPSVHRTLRGLKRLGAFETQRGPYDHENKKRGNTRSKVSPASRVRSHQVLLEEVNLIEEVNPEAVILAAMKIQKLDSRGGLRPRRKRNPFPRIPLNLLPLDLHLMCCARPRSYPPNSKSGSADSRECRDRDTGTTARKTPRPLSDTAARSMAAARPWGCRHDRLRAIAGIPISIPGHLSAL
jgi:hypothetical protein